MSQTENKNAEKKFEKAKTGVSKRKSIDFRSKVKRQTTPDIPEDYVENTHFLFKKHDLPETLTFTELFLNEIRAERRAIKSSKN